MEEKPNNLPLEKQEENLKQPLLSNVFDKTSVEDFFFYGLLSDHYKLFEKKRILLDTLHSARFKKKANKNLMERELCNTCRQHLKVKGLISDFIKHNPEYQEKWEKHLENVVNKK